MNDNPTPSNPTEVPELLPCPFCGCKPIGVVRTPAVLNDPPQQFIKCPDCPAKMEFYSSTILRSVERWNTRTDLIKQPPVKNQCDGVPYEHDGAFKCYKCGAIWGAVTNPDGKTHSEQPRKEAAPKSDTHTYECGYTQTGRICNCDCPAGDTNSEQLEVGATYYMDVAFKISRELEQLGVSITAMQFDVIKENIKQALTTILSPVREELNELKFINTTQSDLIEAQAETISTTKVGANVDETDKEIDSLAENTLFVNLFLQALEAHFYGDDRNLKILNREALSYLVNVYLNQFSATLLEPVREELERIKSISCCGHEVLYTSIKQQNEELNAVVMKQAKEVEEAMKIRDNALSLHNKALNSMTKELSTTKADLERLKEALGKLGLELSPRSFCYLKEYEEVQKFIEKALNP